MFHFSTWLEVILLFIVQIMNKKYNPVFKSFSALSINISAIYLGIIILNPSIITLTQNIIYGIVFLIASIYLETLIEKKW